MENYFGIYVIFGSWNHCKRGPTEHTRHQGVPQGPGTWWWVVLTSYVGWSSTSDARKLISGKNRVKISAQSELRISWNIRNGFWPYLGSAKQKRIEREIQSWRGSRPSTAREAMDQRGNSPPIQGEAKENKKEGGSLPLSLGGAGVLEGAASPPANTG